MKSIFLLAFFVLLITFGVNSLSLNEFSCNVINNGGFEDDISEWLPFSTCPIQTVPGIFLCGNRSMEFTSTTTTDIKGAYQQINIATLISGQSYQIFTPGTITWQIEGFSKSLNVSAGSPSDYSIYVDYAADLSSSRGAVAFLPCASGTTNWQRHITFFNTPSTGVLFVYILFRSRSGTAYFDSISLEYKRPTSNLLLNGGFEYDTNLGDLSAPADFWIEAESVGYTIADITAGIQFAHSDLRSARITIADGQSMWIQQQITTNLNLNTSLPMLVSAWSMAENVTGTPNADYSLYLDVGYSIDGSIVNSTAFIIPFSTGSHDWEYREILVPANPPAVIGNIYVNLVLRSDIDTTRSGTAYFDDVSAYYVDAMPPVTHF